MNDEARHRVFTGCCWEGCKSHQKKQWKGSKMAEIQKHYLCMLMLSSGLF